MMDRLTALTSDSAAPSPLLEVRSLQITSRMGDHEHTVVRDVDLTLAEGEALGIVGESGSGKSMTARAIVGLLPPGLHAEGAVRYQGSSVLGLREREWRAIRGSGIALIMQDPFTMLNPLMRCRDQICELLRDQHGKRLSRSARQSETVRRLAEVGIRDQAVADVYPFQLSGGMRQRVAIAAALARDPQLVIADEPSTALDVTTQREILAQLRALQMSRGMGLILITHDLRVAFSTCDRIAVLYAGSLLEEASAAAMEREPHHPYTLGLLLSQAPADRRVEELNTIPGSVPDPDEVAECCTFAGRCEWAAPACFVAQTPLRQSGNGAATACICYEQIAAEMREARSVASRHSYRVASEVGQPLISVQSVSKTFGDEHSARTVVALKAVDLEIGGNESVGLVGESGSGKTSLARCLVGLEKPTSGRIIIDQIDASDFNVVPRGELQRLRQTIQIIFQDPYSTLNPVRTIGATLREALAVRDTHAGSLSQRTDELLTRVGLPTSYAKRKPIALSGGERQRVAIARALAVNPRIIICDEAVSALDVSVQAQVLNLLASVRRELGISYLFISHDLAVVRQLTERVYVLREGEVVEAGPSDEILDRPQHPYTQSLVESIPRLSERWS